MITCRTCRIVVVILALSVWIMVVKGVEIEQAVRCHKTCINGGQCIVSQAATQAATQGPACSGFQQTCNCPSPYTGEFCEMFILKANCEKGCQNGGHRVASYDEKFFSFICVCPQNYFGDLCEIFIPDPTCEPPCMAGQGECIILPNSQSASHPTGIAICNCSFSSIGYYYGNHCQSYQENDHLCDPPCTPYQGECILLRNSQLASHLLDRTYCNCLTNSTGYFYGKQCQHYSSNARYCPSYCPYGGTCTISGRCNCPEPPYGYVGYYEPGCITFVHVCTPPCQNGGRCTNGGCSCAYTDDGYFTGSTCETLMPPVKQCDPPCVNAEKCESNGVCSCTSNSTHQIYLASVPGCFMQECFGGCLNGGTCGSEGKCRCLKEYTGDNCETYTGCLCRNNGRCYDDKCACVSNETGVFQGALCSDYKFYNPCYPTVLNGGTCLYSYPLCPYDKIGYFHGDQCEKYSLINANCTDPEKEVFIRNKCVCEYSLEEGYKRHRNLEGKCGKRVYI